MLLNVAWKLCCLRELSVTWPDQTVFSQSLCTRSLKSLIPVIRIMALFKSSHGLLLLLLHERSKFLMWVVELCICLALVLDRGVARQSGARGENSSAAPLRSQLSHFLSVDLFFEVNQSITLFWERKSITLFCGDLFIFSYLAPLKTSFWRSQARRPGRPPPLSLRHWY